MSFRPPLCKYFRSERGCQQEGCRYHHPTLKCLSDATCRFGDRCKFLHTGDKIKEVKPKTSDSKVDEKVITNNPKDVQRYVSEDDEEECVPKKRSSHRKKIVQDSEEEGWSTVVRR